MTYKCIRRLVNLLAFFLLVDAIVVFGYVFFGPRILEKFETCVLLRSSNTVSSLLNYLAVTSLFMAMMTSTSINSKSKFTMKIAILCAVLYFIFTTCLLVYFNFSISRRFVTAAYGRQQSAGATSQLSAFISATEPGEDGLGVDDTTIRSRVVELVKLEIWRIKMMFMVSSAIGVFVALFMVIAVNCKIRKSKPEPAKECEVYTRPVGFSTPASLSLRAKKNQGEFS
ncbi:hypothetical protein NEHOM01_1357 [Nematocida homosporus]|uniref:uncharacterized protein n=1 Tax=Nematocida homosporus TaxID=1912981 RepID=UPI00221FD4E8|nr:uncharacterized protein NEHOM01_1357 [Nematocida homosporus]KAI5186268.1 hypothetical protein NEHOM01_1357 [Nematocida homosporus]